MCRYNTPDSGMAGVERVSLDALASLVPHEKGNGWSTRRTEYVFLST